MTLAAQIAILYAHAANAVKAALQTRRAFNAPAVSMVPARAGYLVRAAAAFMVLGAAIYAASEASAAGPTGDTSAQKNVPAIAYQFAIYLLPECGKNPVSNARNLAKKALPAFAIKAPTNAEGTPHLEIVPVKNVQHNYPPPDHQSLHYFGRGLSDEDAKKLHQSTQAVILNVSYAPEHMFTGMLDVLTFTEQLADHCKGLIWDQTTREIFTPAAWHERRIAHWTDDGPRLADHTVIHAYQNTEFIRAITLGMRKFNLPDLAANNFVWSNNRQMGHLLNLIGQSLLEGAKLDENLVLTVDINALKETTLREQIKRSLLDNAAAKIQVPLKVAAAEEGDPDNLILEVDFSQQPGKSVQEKQEAFIAQLFGSQDSIVYVKHNDNIKAASAAAKKKLPQLAEEFRRGLKPGEYIYVKAPFAIPDGGNEWMWLEVIAWDQNEIRGILQNDPHEIPTLKAGAEVRVPQIDVFDYIRYFPDGSSEGNETGKWIGEAAEKTE